jgi:predicted enzyme related to lactoylglutathione lyase
MSTRLAHIVVDANDPGRLARFWAESLGWRIEIDDPHEVEIAGAEHDVNVIFVPGAGPKMHKSRVHLDLRTDSDVAREELRERLLALGASDVDLGQGDVPWGVMADPEGNEFCVTPPGYYDAATGPVGAICLTSAEHAVQTDFWSAATGWAHVRRGLHRGAGPFMVFGGGQPAPMRGKNRVHIDVAPPPDGDHHAEADRLVSLGARRIDIGQGNVPWVVMADPEGNEFCVLSPRKLDHDP